MAIDFDIKDPKNQKMIAIFMVPVVLLVLFYHFMIKPVVTELQSKKAEIVTLTQKLEATKKSLHSPAELNAQKEQLQEKYRELEQYLPDTENVARLLDQLSEVEYTAKVYVVGFDATQTIEGKGKPYKQNKYKMTVQCGYHQFADFMGGIMTLPRILSVSELKMSLNADVVQGEKNEAEAQTDQPRNLTVECILSSYIFTGVQAEEPVSKKSPAKK
ncbi:type 4a pilus biogenesis protein PilO [bacterium]|nr:type 4a pilus biogenesis protein PilO [bacterium]